MAQIVPIAAKPALSRAAHQLSGNAADAGVDRGAAEAGAQGRPGYLRIDTVHQGDQDGVKGVYHINAVDEVTQWQVVGAVAQISEAYLLPVLEAMLAQFPFRIRGFHSDNGSEFINHMVAKLLNKLLIEQTKSRPRHSNDNGLAEARTAPWCGSTWGTAHRRAACGSDRGLLPRALQSVLELSPAVRGAGGGGERQRQGEASVPMVCDAVGDFAATARIGRAPSAGRNDCRIGAAGARENGHRGGRADAGREAQTFRRLSNPEERVRQPKTLDYRAKNARQGARGAAPDPRQGGSP